MGEPMRWTVFYECLMDDDSVRYYSVEVTTDGPATYGEVESRARPKMPPDLLQLAGAARIASKDWATRLMDAANRTRRDREAPDAP